MARTPQEIFAESQAERAQEQEAEAAKSYKNSGAIKGTEAFLGKALSTLTGGGIDYLEMLRRNIGADEKDKVTIDQVRQDANDLYKDRSGLAAAGELAGNVAQFTGAGKGIQLASRGAQALPWLARGGKALETAMTAPGIAGGISSGGITGGVLGTGKEAARLATTDEEFNPWKSAGHIGLEAGLGAVGGAVGGAVAGVTPKGVVAALQRTPVDPKTIGRVQSAADHPIVQALGKTAPEGKASVAEAIRLADEPTLAQLASKLSGLKEVAGKNNTGTLLADEAAGQTARNARIPTLNKMVGQADTAATRAEARLANTGGDQLKPEAYWKVQDDPALRALRDQIMGQERAAVSTGYQTRPQFPMSKTAGDAAAVKDVPAQVVDRITAMKPRANSEELEGIRSALELQSPFFKKLHEAQTTQGLGARMANGALGRGHATPPPTSAGLTNISLGSLLNPKAMIREVALAGRDALQGVARKGAAQRELDMSPAEFLKLIGRRTRTQDVLGNVLPGSFLTGANNAL